FNTVVLTGNLIKQQLKTIAQEIINPYRTSETKLEIIAQARRKNKYFYHGKSLSSITGNSKKKQKSIALETGEQVKITSDLHSSSLSDDCRQILVYVKSLEVPSSMKYLIPLESLIEVNSYQNYQQAILPQIKDLIVNLGLSKQDYHDYIHQAYQVKSTLQLFSWEIFQVFQLYKNKCFGELILN
ncbi:MAG: hypothetical protein ACRC80_03770, partial [Waterburya sp.]